MTVHGGANRGVVDKNVQMMDTTRKPPDVQLFTDGACLDNPGPGGWAFILKHRASGRVKQQTGADKRTTNNRMELAAVIHGLEALRKGTQVDLISDSQYVVRGIGEWMAAWKANGWFRDRKRRRPVANCDLWQKLDELVQQHEVTVNWVRAHAGHPENERCDQLAQAEAERIAQESVGNDDPQSPQDEEPFE